MKLSEIAEAAGCSKVFASQVRAGKFTPHVSTWPALAALAGADVEFVTQGVDTRTVEMLSHVRIRSRCPA